MKKYILLLLLLPNIILGQDELNLIDAIKIGIWENYEIKISKQQKARPTHDRYAVPCVSQCHRRCGTRYAQTILAFIR